MTLETLPEKYLLGHKAIDSQHEVLYQLYRELSGYCENDDYDLDVESILSSLKIYVATHFLYEEELMEETSYQDMVEHKSQHNILKEQVLEQMNKFAALDGKAEEREFVIALKDFLLEWLVVHIAESDRKLCLTML